MHRRTWTLTALVPALCACDSGSSTEVEVTIAGTYNAQSVNGTTITIIDNDGTSITLKKA